jgi:hypothetical protein
MDNRLVSYPYGRNKGVPSGRTYLSHFPQSLTTKKNVQSADNEHASAFLADRGCLSAEKTRKHAAA